MSTHTRKDGDLGKSIAAGRFNSLGLSPQALDRFLDELEAQEQTANPQGVRQFKRRQFRKACVPMQVQNPGGGFGTFAVACRNISRHGMSALHSAYLHVGTRCQVMLASQGNQVVRTSGVIVRCRHVKGMVHELGIRFTTPVDVRSLLSLDALCDWFSLESAAPASLKGSVLYIDASAEDRPIIRGYLASTEFDVTVAEDLSQATERLQNPFDLILCAHEPGVLDAHELLAALRRRGANTPAVVLAGDISSASAAALMSLGKVAVLTRPVSQELLLRAASEFLLLEEAPQATPTRQSTGRRVA